MNLVNPNYDVSTGIIITGYAVKNKEIKMFYSYGGFNLATTATADLSFLLTILTPHVGTLRIPKSKKIMYSI